MSVSTVADILKQRNARVSVDDHWLVFDDTLKEWIIYHDTRKRGKHRIVVESSYDAAFEDTAVDDFLEMTADG